MLKAYVDNFLPTSQDADGYLPNLSNLTGLLNDSNIDREEFNAVLNPKRTRYDHSKQHGTTVDNQFRFSKCSRCQIQVQSGILMDKHMNKFHPELLNKYNCKECSASFRTKLELLLHKISHQNGSLYCPINGCQKSFSRFSALKGHLKVCMHNKVKKGVGRRRSQVKRSCSICGKTFPNFSHLKRHYVIHTGLKLYNCDYCDARFNQKWPLITHINAKHNETIRFSCSDCPASFTTKGNLRVHIRQVHPDDEQMRLKLVCCPFCNSFFKRSSKLSAHHAKYHQKLTEDQQIQITIKDVLKGLQSLNDSGSQPEEMPLMSYYNVAAYTEQYFDGVRWYKCKECDSIFKKPYSINRHMVIHQSVDSFECTICNQKFRLKSNLKKHLKTHANVLREEVKLDHQEITNYLIEPTNSANNAIINIDLSKYANPKYFLTGPQIIHNESKAVETKTSNETQPYNNMHEELQPGYVLQDDSQQCAIQYVIEDNLGTENINGALNLGEIQFYETPATIVNPKEIRSSTEQRAYKNRIFDISNLRRKYENLAQELNFEINCPTDSYIVDKNTLLQDEDLNSVYIRIIEGTGVEDGQFNNINQIEALQQNRTLLQNTIMKDGQFDVFNPLTVDRGEVNFKQSNEIENSSMKDKHFKYQSAVDKNVDNLLQNEVFKNAVLLEKVCKKSNDKLTVYKDNGNIMQNSAFESTLMEGQQCEHYHTTVEKDNGNIYQNITFENTTMKLCPHPVVDADDRNFLQNTVQEDTCDLNVKTVLRKSITPHELQNESFNNPLEGFQANPVNGVFESLIIDSGSSQMLVDDISTSATAQIIDHPQSTGSVVNAQENSNQCISIPKDNSELQLHYKNQECSAEYKNSSFSFELPKFVLPRGSKLYLFLPENNSISSASYTVVRDPTDVTNLNNVLTPEDASISANEETDRFIQSDSIGNSVFTNSLGQLPNTSEMESMSELTSMPNLAEKEVFSIQSQDTSNRTIEPERSLKKPLRTNIGTNSGTSLLKFSSGTITKKSCYICKIVFKSDKMLQQHLYSHIPGGAALSKVKKVCLICNATFKKNTDFNRHQAVHSLKKPFECEKCHRKFSFKSSLKYHKLTHIDKNERLQYKCKVCAKTFLSKGSLKHHITIHNQVRKYQCTLCKEKFRTPSSLTSHVQSSRHKTGKRKYTKNKFKDNTELLASL